MHARTFLDVVALLLELAVVVVVRELLREALERLDLAAADREALVGDEDRGGEVAADRGEQVLVAREHARGLAEAVERDRGLQPVRRRLALRQHAALAEEHLAVERVGRERLRLALETAQPDRDLVHVARREARAAPRGSSQRHCALWRKLADGRVRPHQRSVHLGLGRRRRPSELIPWRSCAHGARGVEGANEIPRGLR